MKRTVSTGVYALIVGMMVAAAGCSGSDRSPAPTPPTQPQPCVPQLVAGELIVVFVPTATVDEARALIEGHGLAVLRVSIGFDTGDDFRWLLVGVPFGTEAFWIAELAKSPLVRIVEQNATFCVD